MDIKDDTKQSKSRKVDGKSVIIIILLIVLVTAVGAAAAIYFKKDKDKDKETDVQPTATATSGRYDSNIILDKDEIPSDDADDVKDGQMSLEMKNVAVSQDGENFSCYICNADENTFDMYITIQDVNSGEQFYKSGLIPVGARIETFKLDKALAKGSYNYVMTYHQVESDGTTEHATVSVAITLNVG